MNQFSRTGPDHVDTKKPPIVAMEEELEQPAIITKDLTSSNLSVPGNAGFIRDFLPCQLVFERANHRHLGNRIDTERGRPDSHRESETAY